MTEGADARKAARGGNGRFVVHLFGRAGKGETAELHDLFGGKGEIERGVLQQHGAALRQRAAGIGGEGRAFEKESAGIGTALARKDGDERRLACPVGTDERGDVARHDPGARAVEQMLAARKDRDVARLDHSDLFLFMRSQRKKGLPMAAVTRPMGSSAGATTMRAKLSAARRSVAPARIEPGSTMR